MRVPAAGRPPSIAWLALAAPLTLAACSDPALSIALSYRSDPDLAAHTGDLGVTVRVRAIDALAAARAATWPRAPGTLDGAIATCEELRFARIPPEVLDTTTVATAAAGGALAGVPRLGDKLIVAEVRAPTGRLDGLGCAPLGDVVDDEAIELELTATVRAVAISHPADPADPLDELDVIALRAWDDAVITGRALAVDRFDRSPRLAPATAMPAMPDGSRRVVGLLADAVPGPVQALVRFEGASEALRVSRWQPIPTLADIDLPVMPGTAAAWAVGRVDLPGQPNAWVAIVAYLDAAGQPALTGVVGRPGGFDRRDLGPTDGVVEGAPVIVDRVAWLVTADGWQRIRLDGVDAQPTPPEPIGAALDALVVPACDGPGARIAVRRGGGYRLYTPARTLVASPLPERIARRRLLGNLCIDQDSPQSAVELMVVADDADHLAVVGEGGGFEAPLADVTALADFAPIGSGPVRLRRGLAAHLTERGPRVRSFRFAVVEVDGMERATVVPTNAIDAPLAGPPVELRAGDLDEELVRDDVLALVPAAPGLRLQVVMDDLIAGQPLAGLSERLPVGAGARARARLAVDDTNRDDEDDIIVLADDGLVVYAGAPLPED